jgi:uncharacterized membrane protein YgcG
VVSAFKSELTRCFSSIKAKAVTTLVAMMVAFCLVGQSDAAEQILDFDTKITVRGDGVVDVTEIIRVRAEGSQIKRGIFRDIPLTFLDESGRRHRVEFDLLGVTRDGRPEPYHTASNSDGIRIYIGEENVFLSDGIYTYSIRYETARQIQFLAGSTELFWNVTGNDWAFPILSATAQITLPEDSAPKRWTAYTGSLGEQGKEFSGRILGDNSLSVATSRLLRPGEGISVVVEIPAGLVASPSDSKLLYYWYLDNLRLILGGFGFLGVFVFYLGAWRAVGRDPPKGTIIPLFHPPEGISPALAGYIHNWGWQDTWRDFTAATLSLAVKGLLVFDDSSGTIVLASVKESEQAKSIDLPPGERAILDWVTSHGGLVTIDEPYGKSLAKVLKSFKSRIEGENRHRFFKRNLGFFISGLAMTVIALGLVLFFGDLSEGELGLLVFAWFVGIFSGIFLMPLVRALAGARSVRTFVAIGINAAAAIVFLFFFFTAAGPAYDALPDDFGRTLLDSFLENSFPFILVGCFAAMNSVFFYLLRAPTAAGRKVMDDIEGLELYIRTAETARLNAVGAPDFTTDHFEKLLPYAIALQAEEPWSEAFATAFASAHGGETVENAYRPTWRGGHGWREAGFVSSIASTIASAQGSFASAIPARSSSSGFSGGGGSGGGGGGGGGGGW